MSKSFKDYYADPEFREKHLKYVMEKTNCQCGKMVARCNLGRHRKSKVHIKWMEENDRPTQIREMKKMIHRLQKNIKELK